MKNTQKVQSAIAYNLGDVIEYDGNAMVIVEVTDKALHLKAVKAPYYSFPVDLPLVKPEKDTRVAGAYKGFDEADYLAEDDFLVKDTESAKESK